MGVIVSPSRIGVRLACRILLLALVPSGCGGGGANPIAPPAAGAAQPLLTVRVSPAPLNATFVSASGASANYRIAADVTLTGLAGIGGRINQITTTFTSQQTVQGATFSSTMSASSSASINIPALGTATYAHTEQFGLGSDVASVIWRLAVSGTDTQGRAFAADSQDVTVNLVR